MSTDVLPVAAPSASIPFDLGLWLGRHQALAWIANRCSAADAHALREIRERKLYRALDLTWEDFCRDHTGFSSKTADRVIEKLEEFGDSYFHLTEILKIPAPEYRALQSAIEDNTLEFEGRRIPITRENTRELMEAIRSLRAKIEKQQQDSWLTSLQKRLDRAAGDAAAALRRTEGTERDLLMLMIEDHVDRIVEAAKAGQALPSVDPE